MLHRETAFSPFQNCGFHSHNVSKRRRHKKPRARLHHRNSRQPVLSQHFLLLKSRFFKKSIRARIKHFEKAWVIDNARRIAIAPLNLNLLPVFQHPRVLHFQSSQVYLTRSLHTKPFLPRTQKITLSACLSSTASFIRPLPINFSLIRRASSPYSILNL